MHRLNHIPQNWTVEKSVVNKETGKTSWRTVGYYPKLKNAVNAILQLEQEDYVQEHGLKLLEAIKHSEQVCLEALADLERRLKDVKETDGSVTER